MSWVVEALHLLSQDRGAMDTSKLEWRTVQSFVMRHVQCKKDRHRCDGKGGFDMSRAATFDLLEDVEKIRLSLDMTLSRTLSMSARLV